MSMKAVIVSQGRQICSLNETVELLENDIRNLQRENRRLKASSRIDDEDVNQTVKIKSCNSRTCTNQNIIAVGAVGSLASTSIDIDGQCDSEQSNIKKNQASSSIDDEDVNQTVKIKSCNSRPCTNQNIIAVGAVGSLASTSIDIDGQCDSEQSNIKKNQASSSIDDEDVNQTVKIKSCNSRTCTNQNIIAVGAVGSLASTSIDIDGQCDSEQSNIKKNQASSSIDDEDVNQTVKTKSCNSRTCTNQNIIAVGAVGSLASTSIDIDGQCDSEQSNIKKNRGKKRHLEEEDNEDRGDERNPPICRRSGRVRRRPVRLVEIPVDKWSFKTE